MEKRMNKMVMNLVLLAACAMLCVPVFAADDGYALLIQQSPPDGGAVNLGSGVHKMDIGQTVTLSATPKTGYRFLYWLGDVSAVDAVETSIQIDSPKMVVAVFARDEFEEEPRSASSGATGITGGGGYGGSGQRGISPSVTINSGGAISPASAYEYNPADIIYDYPEYTDDDDTDFPVPGDGENVPEPATLVLLGIGSTALLLRRKRS